MSILIGAISGGLMGAVGYLLFRLFGGDPKVHTTALKLTIAASIIFGLYVVRPQLAGFVIGLRCGWLEGAGASISDDDRALCAKIGIELPAE